MSNLIYSNMRYFFSLFIFFYATSSLIAQIRDDFNRSSLDLGEILWERGVSSGVTGDFTINNYQLQAQFDKGSGTRTCWLSTIIPTISQDYIFEWEFKVKIDFGNLSSSLSNRNKAQIFLSATENDLNLQPNGYFIEAKPVAKEDSITFQLFKIEAGTTTLLEGLELIKAPSYEFADLRVRRNNLGEWETWVNGQSQGKVIDAAVTIEGFFGAKIFFSSGSREDRFFFDDFSLIRYPYLDTAIVNNEYEISLIFSTTVDSILANEVSNYLLNENIQPDFVKVNSDTVLLSFTETFSIDIPQKLDIITIADSHGNKTPLNQSISTSFIYTSPDIYPPKIENIKGLQDSLIIIQFDEVLAERNFPLQNFALSQTNQNPISIVPDTANSLALHFKDKFIVGNTYELIITGISDNLGNTLHDSLWFTFEFNDRLPPRITTLSLINSNVLQVEFSEKMDSLSISNPIHFELNSSISPKQIIKVEERKYRLFFEDVFKENEELILAIKGVKDQYLNTLSDTWEGTFIYDTEKPSIPTNQGVYPISEKIVKVIFTESIDNVTASIVNNYELSSSIAEVLPSFIEIDSIEVNTVYLHYLDTLESEIEYSLKVSGVADLAGNIMNTRTRKFYYDIRPPVVKSVELFPDKKILLTFNEAPDFNLHTDTLHFAATGIHPFKIERFYEHNSAYWLFFYSLSITDSILFTVDNLSDFQGNMMLKTDSFLINTSSPTISSVQAVSSNSLLIHFSMSIDSIKNIFKKTVHINGMYADSIQLIGAKAIYTFPMEWEVDRVYHLQVDSLFATNGNSSTNLIRAFQYHENVISAYIKDENQIAVQYDEALLKDSLSIVQFSLNNQIPIALFANETGTQITLLFSEKLLPDSKYELQIAPQLIFNGDISPKRNFSLIRDTSPPSIKNAFFSEFQKITVLFDEAISENTAEALNHYWFKSNEIVLYPTKILVLDINKVEITFDYTFKPNYTYQIQVQNIVDLSGNLTNHQIVDITFPDIPEIGSLVINEIMADPTPTQGLPEVEYIELYNPTTKPVNLLHVYLGDATSSIPLGYGVVPAGGFSIICNESNQHLFNQTLSLHALKSFPSITNSGEILQLHNSKAQLIDEVNFSSNWYESNKKSGGWALERIQTNYDCVEKDNWRSTLSNNGGTPGEINSVINTIPDTTSPYILNYELINSSMAIYFSEEMDTVFNDTVNQLKLNDGIQVPLSTWISKDTLLVSFTEPLTYGQVHKLTIQNFTDCFGNSMAVDTLHIAKGKKPSKHDIIITEIMADPTPSVGLPDVEYLEIYNTTAHLMDLSGCSLNDATNSTQLKGYLSPNSYAILCSSSNISLFEGNIIPINNFPSLNNSGESLLIKNSLGELIYFVAYDDTWYQDDEKKMGGYSLEMMDVSFPCGQKENWSATSNSFGGTPGKENSLKAIITDNTPPKISYVYVEDSLQLLVGFNENVDSISLMHAIYTVRPTVEISNLAFTSKHLHNTVTLFLANPLEKGINYTIGIKNLQDCTGNTKADFSYKNFVLPEVANKNDILLSEILFNPPPNGTDFIELFNASDKYINLQNWKIVNARGDEHKISSTIFIIKPEKFLILTANETAFKNQYTNVPDSLIHIMKLPSMNDDSGTVTIVSDKGETIQSFSYNEQMHFRLLEDEEGVSLERIDYKISEANMSNWHSAASTVGFATPGDINSQNKRLTKATEDCFSISPEIFSPDLDGQDDFAQIHYSCQSNGTMASVSVFDAQGRLIKRLLDNQTLAQEGFLRWDGTKDNGERVNMGYYIILIETFDLDGNINSVKLKVAVASKF